MRLPTVKRNVRGAALNPATARAPGPTGLSELGGAISQAGEVAGKIALEARSRADAVAASDAENALQSAVIDEFNSDERGALHKHGIDAIAAVDGAYANIEKKRADLAQGLNDRARAVFEAQATTILQSARRTGENHAAQQRRVAEAATLDAAQSTALDALARNPYDEEEVATQMNRVLPRLRAFAVSPEDADAQQAGFVRSVADARINRMLEDGDDEAAAALFARSKDILGPKGREYERVIGAMKRTREADSVTQAIVTSSRDEATGWVDRKKALDALAEFEGTNADTKTTDEVRRRTHEQLSLAKQAEDTEVDGWFEAAYSRFNEGGLRAIPPRLWDKLNEYAPAKAAFFKDKAAKDARAKSKDSRAWARIQAENDKIARDAWATLPPDERAGVNVKSFLASYGASKVAIADTEAAQRKHKDNLATGAAAGETRFMSLLSDAAGGKLPPEKKAAIEAAGAETYRNLASELKRQPTPEEATKAIDSILKTETREEPGLLWGTNEVAEPAYTRMKREREERRKAEPPKDTNPPEARITLGGAAAPPAAPVHEFDADEPQPAPRGASDVPPAERAKIEAAFGRFGKALTDEEISRIYAKKVGR